MQNSGRSFNFLAEFLKIEQRCRFCHTSPRASLSWCIVGDLIVIVPELTKVMFVISSTIIIIIMFFRLF